MRGLARSPLAVLAAALWGYAEATRFWLIPDILLGWIAFNRSRHTTLSVFAATIGAMVGGARMHRDAAAEHARLTEVPGISDAMLADTRSKFADQGWAAMVRAPIDGIPYKVYATESALAGRPLGELLAWTVPSRMWRFALTAVGAALLGALFARSARRHEGRWLGIVVAFWTYFYARYFAKLRSARRGEGHDAVN